MTDYYMVSNEVCKEIQNIPDFLIGLAFGLIIVLFILLVIEMEKESKKDGSTRNS